MEKYWYHCHPVAQAGVIQTVFSVASLSQSSSFAGGTRLSGYKHLLVNGRSPATQSWEILFMVQVLKVMYQSLPLIFTLHTKYFFGCYHETGRAVAAVTVSGDTITRASHGFAVGDKLTFQASVAPTGMFLTAGYYVVSVPTADTFKVSLNKGGSAVTFFPTGTLASHVYWLLCLDLIRRVLMFASTIELLIWW